MIMKQHKNWRLIEDGHIARLTLNRPEHQNSLDAETLHELRDVTAFLRGNKDVWVVIVEGEGKHFSAGMDLEVIQERLGKPDADNRAFLLDLQGCLDDFEALEKPTTAKLQGFCIGGGLILALCCDFRIASERTVFNLPEVRLGLGVIMGTQRVTRTAGVAATKELVLLGRRFKAKEALDYGLVNAVVPPGELDDAVDALAEKFLVLPPRTVGISKRIINQGLELTLRESQDLEIEAQVGLIGSRDMQEAIESYVEVRKPRFTGE